MCQNACFAFFKMKEVHSEKNIESFREKHYKDFDTFSCLQNSKKQAFCYVFAFKIMKRCVFKLLSF